MQLKDYLLKYNNTSQSVKGHRICLYSHYNRGRGDTSPEKVGGQGVELIARRYT